MFHKWQSYDAWFLRHGVQQTNFFCHFGPFFALLLPNNLKNQNFEKMKKTPGDIIILHMCTINDNHIMYDSWDTERNKQFFVILDYFLPFYPPKNPKDQNVEKINKHMEIQGSTNLIFACTDFRACKMVLCVHLCIQN